MFPYLVIRKAMSSIAEENTYRPTCRSQKKHHRPSAKAKKSIEQERKPRNPCKRFQSAACHQAHKRLIETKFGFRLVISNSLTSFISRKQQLQRIISSKAEEVPQNRSASDEHVEHVAPHENFMPDRSLN